MEVKEDRMRARILAILAYTGAGLILAVAVCVPFVLMGVFSNVVAHAGLHIALNPSSNWRLSLRIPSPRV